jgi:hypothetical protein
MEINEIELACDLANDAVKDELRDVYNEDDLVEAGEDLDTVVWIKEAQEVFNRHYDYFLGKINNCKI